LSEPTFTPITRAALQRQEPHRRLPAHRV